MEQEKFNAKVEVEKAKILVQIPMDYQSRQTSAATTGGASISDKSDIKITGSTQDNKAKHSEKSSIQPERNGDKRGKIKRKETRSP
jgi:hypothetical protein